jgi:hypothetical protein
MKKYVSPDVETVEFNNEIILYASGCNCIYDKWNELQPPNISDCEGDSYDAEELFGNKAIIPG